MKKIAILTLAMIALNLPAFSETSPSASTENRRLNDSTLTFEFNFINPTTGERLENLYKGEQVKIQVYVNVPITLIGPEHTAKLSLNGCASILGISVPYKLDDFDLTGSTVNPTDTPTEELGKYHYFESDQPFVIPNIIPSGTLEIKAQLIIDDKIDPAYSATVEKTYSVLSGQTKAKNKFEEIIEGNL